MSNRGILVGAIDGQKLYYLPDVQSDSQPDGAIVEKSGRTRFINFSQTLSTARNIEKFASSEFHDFLWGSHEGDDLKLWTAIFINKSRDVPKEMLKDVDIRDDFSPGQTKNKKTNRKAKAFKKNKEKSLEFKGLGRTISSTLRSVPFDPNAVDADNDGFVQDATPWMRPALPMPALRSMSSSVLQANPDTVKEFGELIEPEILDEMFEVINHALSKGATGRNRRVKLPEYLNFGEPELIKIVDINPATGEMSEIEIGSESLMEAEEHAFKVGRRLLDIALSRVDLEAADKARAEKVQEISDQFMRLSKVRIEAAKKIGILYGENRYGKIVPNTRLKRDRPPSDKALLRIHSDLIKDLDASDAAEIELKQRARLSPLDLGLEREKIEWRRKRNEIYAKYEAAVLDAYEKEVKKAGGPSYEQSEKEAADLLAKLRTEKSSRQVLFDEIINIFKELGVSFGTETLEFQIPRRNSTEEDRAFTEAAKRLADQTSTYASRNIPDALIRQINASVGPRGIKVKLVPDGSEHAGSWAKSIRRLETNGEESVTVHELIHAAADANPFLSMIQMLMLWRRRFASTTGSTSASRKKKPSDLLMNGWEEYMAGMMAGDLSKFLEDHFADVYAGRIYEQGMSAETLTRSYDYLLDKTLSDSRLTLDEDLIASTFGAILMASLVGDDFQWW